MSSTRIFANAFDLSGNIPACLLKVFSSRPFKACSPDVFKSVPEVEVHVLRNLDALNSARVARVMGRVID